MSEFKDHRSAASHPKNVHPKTTVSIVIANILLCFLIYATMTGMKYIASERKSHVAKINIINRRINKSISIILSAFLNLGLYYTLIFKMYKYFC